MSESSTLRRSKGRIVKGGILAIVGWILSPLTWWNDLLVNIPIAYGFGCLFSLISESLFLPFMVVGYWFTNILGLFLLHKGVITAVSKGGRRYGKKDLLKDLAIAVGYTAVIVTLIQLNILRLPGEYLPCAP
jgi:mannose/fructose/N-acetylgalactosamine-specific phosphotransferase system component IIC